MQIRDAVRLSRPEHWIKNLVVVIPLIFSMRMTDPQALLKTGGAVLAFCFASSFCYILNDMKDRAVDRQHPTKKQRPLASGRVSVGAAVVEAVVFFVMAFVISCVVSKMLLIIVGVYVSLQICYTFSFKHKVLIDVICIALGFVLRAGSGVAAIGAEVSPWLFVCIFTLCLFMGFCKRYNEVTTLGDIDLAKGHRPTLISYTPDLLTHLITLSAGIAVVSFLVYGLSESTIQRFGTDYFVYTLPLVVYGIFRFAMLSMRGTYADPTDLILHDRAFQFTVLIWVLLALGIIVWGSRFSGWVAGL